MYLTEQNWQSHSCSRFNFQVWPRSLWLDCWPWGRVHGDAVWTGGHTKCHTAHPQVYRWVYVSHEHGTTTPAMVVLERSLSALVDYLCVFREPYHHTEENPALPVVSWPLDKRVLQLPWKRLFSAGSGEHDGAPAYKGITDTSTYAFILKHKCVHRAYTPTST